MYIENNASKVVTEVIIVLAKVSLMDRFASVCKKMCNKKKEISKSLQDFEANNAKTN